VLAHHIVEDHLVVGLEDDALEIARLVAQRGVPGVVVADADGRLHALLGPPDVLRRILPPAVRESPSLARVYDEQHADRIAHGLAGRTVRDLFPDPLDRIPLVRGRATAVELAQAMAYGGPLVVVREQDRTLGVITASCLLRRLVWAA
jgi:predicted transcriptional regulator